MRLIIILLLISSLAKAQNTIYFVYQPIDLGIGLRYDRQVNMIGYYASLTRGNYAFGEDFVKDHEKITIGAIVDKFSFGLSYNKYGQRIGEYRKNTFKPVSFEIGVKGVRDWLAAGIRIDIRKHDIMCDVGLNF